MPMTKKKIASKLKGKTGTRKRRARRAIKRVAKNPARTPRKKIATQTGNKKTVPPGTSLEVFEVVETEVYEQPVLGEFQEEES